MLKFKFKTSFDKLQCANCHAENTPRFCIRFMMWLPAQCRHCSGLSHSLSWQCWADSALSYLGYKTAVFCTLCSSQARALLGDIMQSGHDYRVVCMYIDILISDIKYFLREVLANCDSWLGWWADLRPIAGCVVTNGHHSTWHTSHTHFTHTHTHNSAKWDTQVAEDWQK